MMIEWLRQLHQGDWIPEAIETTRIAIDLFTQYCADHADAVADFDNFESLYLGTVGPDGGTTETLGGIVVMLVTNRSSGIGSPRAR